MKRHPRVVEHNVLNTSQGPAKSITTAPSEIKKATGIVPLAGGVSGFTTVSAALTRWRP
jgi:hypothetical protein